MLSYCLNVHPGTTLDAVRNAVLVRAPEVYDYLHKMGDFEGPNGVGIWLPADAARELDGKAEAFADDVRAAGLKCHTFNGFPYGRFHGTRVKDTVYLPDWSDLDRVQHTMRLARILTAFLEDGEAGSISTVPVGYRTHFDDEKLQVAVDNLMTVASHLDALNAQTGRPVRLALEPEPDCLLDSIDATLAFFDKHVPASVRHVIGLCLDLTHVAVEFETPLETLKKLKTAGIPVYKVQIGSALIGEQSSNLNPFADEIYLHQTKVLTDSGKQSYPDLPLALAANPLGEWRIHYHVPLIWEGRGSLHSSRDEITSEFFNYAKDLGVDSFEVETYTLSLFPEKTKSDAEILAGELAWVHEIL